MAANQRIRAKQRAEQVAPRYGDEHATAKRYGFSVSKLRKDRASPNPVFPYTKIPRTGRGGGAVRYDWERMDRIMEENTYYGQEEVEPA